MSFHSSCLWQRTSACTLHALPPTSFASCKQASYHRRLDPHPLLINHFPTLASPNYLFVPEKSPCILVIKMMKRNSLNERIMAQTNKKKSGDNKNARNNRFLIIINVLGSTGPIRFVVNEDDLVAAVINTALKSYAKEGRLPVLGSDANNFLLYPANAGSDALSPSEKIGMSQGGRNFVLCKKAVHPQKSEERSEMIGQKNSRWKAWLNKSFSFKILTQ